ncbi:MAG: hypothetical protein OXH92_10695 [Bryobacterales bacterium]|nr:hypothetical protein [Bryobacterales bacterium]MDE0292907.1 hypothetical protein [Bryobacterales bacterium]MDE0434463.1 hypothetical protein [Bryobacterales bacterium]
MQARPPTLHSGSQLPLELSTLPAHLLPLVTHRQQLDLLLAELRRMVLYLLLLPSQGPQTGNIPAQPILVFDQLLDLLKQRCDLSIDVRNLPFPISDRSELFAAGGDQLLIADK